MSNLSKSTSNNPYLSVVLKHMPDDYVMDFSPCIIELNNSNCVWAYTHITDNGICIVKDAVKMMEYIIDEESTFKVTYIPIKNPNQDKIKRLNDALIVSVDVMSSDVLKLYEDIITGDVKDVEEQNPIGSNIVSFPKK